MPALPSDATVLVCSTVPSRYMETLPSRIADGGRPDILVVDCPISSGAAKGVTNGSLTVFAAGTDVVIRNSDALLRAMSDKLYIIPGGVGAASKAKMINQLLVHTHAAAAAEAIGLATRAGIDTPEVFNIVSKAAGGSWAFENCVPRMLAQDWTPLYSLNNSVKDMVTKPPTLFQGRHY